MIDIISMELTEQMLFWAAMIAIAVPVALVAGFVLHVALRRASREGLNGDR